MRIMPYYYPVILHYLLLLYFQLSACSSSELLTRHALNSNLWCVSSMGAWHTKSPLILFIGPRRICFLYLLILDHIDFTSIKSRLLQFQTYTISIKLNLQKKFRHLLFSIVILRYRCILKVNGAMTTCILGVMDFLFHDVGLYCSFTALMSSCTP